MKDDLVYGIHAAKQILNCKAQDVFEVFIQAKQAAAAPSPAIQELVTLVQELGLPLSWLEKNKLDQWTDNASHQGVVLRCKTPQAKTEKEFDVFLAELMNQNKAPLILVLDNVTDPHNLGACLRTAAAAGVDAVVFPRDNSAGLNATVRKVAAGAADILNIFSVTNLARSLDKLKEQGVWIVGTALSESAKNIYQMDLKGPLAIVMGSEGQGLRRLTQEKCDFVAYVPMAAQMQSLNVSVATGVCLFEALRQRS